MSLAVNSKLETRNSKLYLGRAKAGVVFRRNEERLDHLGATEVAPKLVELMQPEVVAIEIGVGRLVWVPLQIAKVLHRHKGRT